MQDTRYQTYRQQRDQRIRQRDAELEAERLERVRQLSSRIPQVRTAARMLNETTEASQQ